MKASVNAIAGLCLSLAAWGGLPSPTAAQEPLLKRGNCPSGYHASGDYCLANSEKSKNAIFKVGSCPSDYRVSKDYCLEN